MSPAVPFGRGTRWRPASNSWLQFRAVLRFKIMFRCGKSKTATMLCVINSRLTWRAMNAIILPGRWRIRLFLFCHQHRSVPWGSGRFLSEARQQCEWHQGGQVWQGRWPFVTQIILVESSHIPVDDVGLQLVLTVQDRLLEDNGVPIADQDIPLDVHLSGRGDHQSSKKRGDEALEKYPCREIYEHSLSGWNAPSHIPDCFTI